MAKKMTSKKPLHGNLRSHACNATKHAQKPNLQKITLDNGESVRVSTRELRTMRKNSANAVNNEVINNEEIVAE